MQHYITRFYISGNPTLKIPSMLGPAEVQSYDLGTSFIEFREYI